MLAVIARILTSDCDKCVCVGSSVPALYHKHPQHWCKMFCVCVSIQSQYFTLWIIQCHFLNLQEQLCLYGVNTSWRLVYSVCVYCCREGLLCATAARLKRGEAQAGRFDWTPGRAHALSLSELNGASSWLEGCCVYSGVIHSSAQWKQAASDMQQSPHCKIHHETVQS